MSEKKKAILGWAVSAIPALMLLSGAVNAWRGAAMVANGMVHLGYPVSIMGLLGTTECVCAVLYLVPRSAFLGAILLSAYLGGATASHVRIGERQWVVPVILGVLVWVGLALRDVRVRELAFRAADGRLD